MEGKGVFFSLPFKEEIKKRWQKHENVKRTLAGNSSWHEVELCFVCVRERQAVVMGKKNKPS